VQTALFPPSLASRRRFLGTAGAATLTLSPLTALADAMIKLPLPGGPDERSITTAFPQKGARFAGAKIGVFLAAVREGSLPLGSPLACLGVLRCSQRPGLAKWLKM
jgi:hypothetical protein